MTSTSELVPRTSVDQLAGLTDGITTGRWRIFSSECCEGFVVQHESGSGDSMGGEDTTHSARAMAADIERWSAASVGVDAPPEFFDALRRNAVAAELQAQEIQVEAIRCRALYEDMRARAEVARAEAVQRGWSKPYAPSSEAGEAGCGK